ncbi:mitochondrial 54S ribosomal protein mL58 [Aspergillus stella-maris]|uniref:mitochondrial 54S ribosomal protein mL58 n=1 Tax=Aspergillus stella-maris TaxID=1810926 RepID=UPI003CCD9782
MAAFVTASRRPILSSPFFLPSFENLSLELRRNQSSYRRTKQRLRIKPDASFGPSVDKSHDHIIYNPPSSSPSVYHTPTKFLPTDDARRTLRPNSPEDTDKLPAAFKPTNHKKYHLTPSDVKEIRNLRLSDPLTWSRGKLAKRFDCSRMFIAHVCEASPQKKEMQKQVLEAIKSRWGAKRRMAREDRQLRKEAWGRDE